MVGRRVGRRQPVGGRDGGVSGAAEAAPARLVAGASSFSAHSAQHFTNTQHSRHIIASALNRVWHNTIIWHENADRWGARASLTGRRSVILCRLRSVTFVSPTSTPPVMSSSCNSWRQVAGVCWRSFQSTSSTCCAAVGGIYIEFSTSLKEMLYPFWHCKHCIGRWLILAKNLIGTNRMTIELRYICNAYHNINRLLDLIYIMYFIPA